MTSETVQKIFDALWVLKIFAVNYRITQIYRSTMEDSLLSCLKAWLVYIYVLARSLSLISGYQSLDFSSNFSTVC